LMVMSVFLSLNIVNSVCFVFSVLFTLCSYNCILLYCYISCLEKKSADVDLTMILSAKYSV